MSDLSDFDPSDFDLASAELRLGLRDAREQAEWLAGTLTRLLPDHARQTRARSLLGADQGLRELRVVLGDYSYRLEVVRGRVTPSRTHRVGGIDLKTEPVGMAEWLALVSEGVRAEARRSAALADALSLFNRSGGTV